MTTPRLTRILALVFFLLVAVAAVAWLLQWFPGGGPDSALAPAPAGPVGDWPQWRYDANRSAACPGELPEELRLQWVRQYPALEPAWPEPVNQDRMPFDRVYEPVVAGSMLFFGSSRNDRVTALDTRTGEELWRFYADGPVRLPASVHNGKLFVASDDGRLYCLEALTGKLLWTFRGGPSDSKVLGNGRLVSTWPARGGPVVRDGAVYFAASIWPFMGVFIYCLDAETGQPLWTNDAAGQMYMSQPHAGADAFAGIAPQGALVATDDRLLVPGGRSLPACLDRSTGKLLYYHLDGSSYHDHPGGPDHKLEGGSHVAAMGKFFFNHRGLNTTMYDLESGEAFIMWRRTTYPVLTDDTLYLSGDPIVALDLGSLRKTEFHREERDTRSKIVRDTRRYRWEMDTLWECPVDGTASLIKVGSRLFAGGAGVVSALKLGGDTPEVVWSAAIEGTAARLIAGDGRLFVITLEGRIYAFGDQAVTEPKVFPMEGSPASTEMSGASGLVAEMIRSAAVAEGYCLAFGLTDGTLVESIARQTNFQVVAVDPDAAKVESLRRRFDDAGLYGTRISVQQGDPATYAAPPYVASLIVSESPAAIGFGARPEVERAIFRSLRPYGGTAWIPVTEASGREALVRHIASCGLEGSRVDASADGAHVLLSRQGPLPGSAPWTHMYADVANTVKSNDRLVRLPLGLLWFGGNSHEDVLPRHAHGPPEQIIGGRLFIEGDNCLSARDVYTGRVLWKRTFADLGTFGIYYDESYVPDPLDTTYNQMHIAGANARGTNFVASDDGVYLVIGGKCVVLDPATGDTLRTLVLPPEGDGPQSPTWGYVGLADGLLIAGRRMVRFSEDEPATGTGEPAAKNPWQDFDTSSSASLVVMDRLSGQVLWTRKAEQAFRHSAIAVGNGRLYCIDSLPHPVMFRQLLRGKAPKSEPRLLCLDLRTGRVIWETTEGVFGTWLGYSGEHDVLLQSGRASPDMLAGEPSERMIVYRGADGGVVWDKDILHQGPCILHGETIFLNSSTYEGGAVGLLTGEPKIRLHPLTGERIPWQYRRKYGCNSSIGSEHMLTFRSGAAGYYDLNTESGTGNFGGFKSGCTSNLIVADGVLNAPDYTRTCTCSYQNQTSLALVHEPDVEAWTFEQFHPPALPVPAGDGAVGEGADNVDPPAARIRRMGLNLGAPGDRVGPGGTLWLDWPMVGGPSPNLVVMAEPVAAPPEGGRGQATFAGTRLCLHSSRIERADLPWVAASGLAGVTRIVINLAEGTVVTDPESGRSRVVANLPSGEATYTVRLHFAELQDRSAGQRVFDVAVQGRPVLEDFDIAREAGGPRRGVVREVAGVRAAGTLTVALTAQVGEPLLCGIELVQEETDRP